MTASRIQISGYTHRAWSPDQRAALAQIFFTSSATQSFASAADKAAFKERWLGRYLLADGPHVFLATDAVDTVVGYLAGSIADIARQPRFADMATASAFAASSAVYPAHLHINIAEHARGQGVGAQLIETFAAHATAQGAPGMHVVTGAASRNVQFYERCGFIEIDRRQSAANAVVFLGRTLIGL